MSQILLVEPDRVLAQTYIMYLEIFGHKVRWCQQAQLAVDLIDSQKPEIVILEVQLVDHAGIEFLYEIRSYPEWQSIPIIVQSMVPKNLLFSSIQQMKNLGVIQYLYKPNTNLSKLNKVVYEVLETTKV